MKQFNFQPSTKGGTNLDLLIHNILGKTSDVNVCRYKLKTDHYMLDIELSIAATRAVWIPRVVFKYNTKDFLGLKSDLTQMCFQIIYLASW